jgi:hypothetical protein
LNRKAKVLLKLKKYISFRIFELFIYRFFVRLLETDAQRSAAIRGCCRIKNQPHKYKLIFKIITEISKNTQVQQSCITAVKSRFFAQYWGQEVGLQCEGGGSGFVYIISEGTLNDLEIRNDKLLLKQLSKITNEDAEKLQYTLVNVVGLDGLIRQNSIELVKEVVSNYEQIDCLFMLPSSFTDLARELGYAIDWNNHKVSKQIELGWVQML